MTVFFFFREKEAGKLQAWAEIKAKLIPIEGGRVRSQLKRPSSSRMQSSFEGLAKK